MPQLKAGLKMRHARAGGALDLIDKRLERFLAEEMQARVKAARTATEISRRTWDSRLNRRPVANRALVFKGRSSTGGQMGSMVRWGATKNGQVRLDVTTLDRRAPHWIIQEIGTGKRATIKRGGRPNPIGRPSKSSLESDRRVRAVKSQSGRRIRAGLVFADASGNYSRPGSARNEALYPASTVRGVPGRRASIVIRNEIKGQHFAKKGGSAGFRQYKTDVLMAARKAFARRV